MKDPADTMTRDMFSAVPPKPEAEKSMIEALDDGRRLRDEGVEKVADNSREWQELARADFLSFLTVNREGTSGEWHYACEKRGFPKPHHPNAWGAVTATLAKRKEIVWTGKVRAAVCAQSHASMLKVWRRRDNDDPARYDV